MVPVNLMQSFVSAQVYALRHFSSATALPQDHWGFAWAPRNPGLANADYVNQSRAILDRLAAAIRDSGQQTNPADPGIEACTGSCTSAAVPHPWEGRCWNRPSESRSP